MRPHDPVDSEIERLLGVKLSLLGPVRRNPHHRRDGGCERSGLGDLPAIEHVLQAIPQRPDVPWIMLHLEDNAVVLGGAHGDGGLGIGLAKRGERRLARFQRADDAIEAWNIGHALYPRYGLDTEARKPPFSRTTAPHAILPFASADGGRDGASEGCER